MRARQRHEILVGDQLALMRPHGVAQYGHHSRRRATRSFASRGWPSTRAAEAALPIAL
jgi:hypothetical protein